MPRSSSLFHPFTSRLSCKLSFYSPSPRFESLPSFPRAFPSSFSVGKRFFSIARMWAADGGERGALSSEKDFHSEPILLRRSGLRSSESWLAFSPCLQPIVSTDRLTKRACQALSFGRLKVLLFCSSVDSHWSHIESSTFFLTEFSPSFVFWFSLEIVFAFSICQRGKNNLLWFLQTLPCDLCIVSKQRGDINISIWLLQSIEVGGSNDNFLSMVFRFCLFVQIGAEIGLRTKTRFPIFLFHCVFCSNSQAFFAPVFFVFADLFTNFS